MAIWQIHALATVLNTPVYSVYPNLGNTTVRKNLNRLIFPISKTSQNPVYIMWTSNREDMRQDHWVPNHFVPLLPKIFPEEEKEDTDQMTFESNYGISENKDILGDAKEDIITMFVYKNENSIFEISVKERDNESQEKEISGHSKKRDTVNYKNEVKVEQENEILQKKRDVNQQKKKL